MTGGPEIFDTISSLIQSIQMYMVQHEDQLPLSTTMGGLVGFFNPELSSLYNRVEEQFPVANENRYSARLVTGMGTVLGYMGLRNGPTSEIPAELGGFAFGLAGGMAVREALSGLYHR